MHNLLERQCPKKKTASAGLVPERKKSHVEDVVKTVTAMS